MLLMIHSLLAFALLALLIASIVKSLLSAQSNKPFLETDRKVALFTLIAAHTQLLLGFLVYFTSTYFDMLKDDAKAVMADKALRLLAVEHPFTNILAVVMITVGFAAHKKLTEDKAKFMKIATFYGLGLILLLSRIPWNQWMAG